MSTQKATFETITEMYKPADSIRNIVGHTDIRLSPSKQGMSWKHRWKDKPDDLYGGIPEKGRLYQRCSRERVCGYRVVWPIYKKECHE